jgi:hypothetical protein
VTNSEVATAADNGSRRRIHQFGVKDRIHAQQSRGNKATNAMPSTAADHGVGSISATQPTNDGTTLAVNSRPAAGA